MGLTERESELLSLLSTGMTNRELGEHLYVSENTIKTQLRHLYAKLDVRNRAQAASFAAQGILGDHRPPSQNGGLAMDFSYPDRARATNRLAAHPFHSDGGNR